MSVMAVGIAPQEVQVEPLLRIQNLAVQFGPLQALNGVDLEIQPGEIVALAGENGAGKSTLVRCIAGDMAPTSGEVTLGGEHLPADPALASKRGIAVVWQDLALCDNLDVAANLLLGRETAQLMLSETRFHAAAGRLLNEMQVPLADTTRNVRTLSGGQRQLLAVARAIRDRPRLLILDEPTAALGVSWSAQVEELTRRLRDRGTTILLVSHDIEQMFRLADRIAVLRHGRIISNVNPAHAHPDDVVALMSGQQVDVSARRQLDRLQGLVDQLASADPSSSLTLILSALGAALGAERICVHLLDDGLLQLAGSVGLGEAFQAAWSRLPLGIRGGPVGLAAATETATIDMDAATSSAWAAFPDLARIGEVGSSWAVPVVGNSGLIGVITVFRRATGRPGRDELDLVTLYAGYVVSAVERDRLLDQVTARNRVLETIREVLEALAGPAPLPDGLNVALGALRRGLRAAQVGLAERLPDGELTWRALVGASGALPVPVLRHEVFDPQWCDGRAREHRPARGGRELAVGFLAPGGAGALVACWPDRGDTIASDPTDTSLLEDAARSFHLALEREESERAHQETRALRRSQELQRGFLSRLSHELRTPLTAIRGYASSLLQTDVTWDGESERRFLSRIATEAARVGRLVDDLLDFSVIESDMLRLQRDWCDIELVLDAAAACLPPASAAAVSVSCESQLPVVWADHDRLEQVFVNLLDNATRHNPAGTKVQVSAAAVGPSDVVITVTDDGTGIAPDLVGAPFAARRASRSPMAGAGLGLSIAKGIVDAHGGQLRLEPLDVGTRFRIQLPVEAAGAMEGSEDA
jgi:ABC-type multidrug transport system ATPase subunit/nitrogen-specific signal transduction histidine kinase